MAKVYDIKVRYLRRMQVREYEPIEAEVTLSAQVADDEEYGAAAESLMMEARNTVKAGLTGKLVENTLAAIKTKPKAAAKQNPKAAAKQNPKAEEIPGDKKPASVRKTAAKKGTVKPTDPEPEEIPDDIPDTDDAPVMSIQDLQAYVGASVTSRKIKPVKIKEIIAAYDAVRLSDIPEGDRSSVKAAIDDAMLLE